MVAPPLPYKAATRPRPQQHRTPKSNMETLREAILRAAAHVGDEMASDAAEKGEERPDGLMGYLEMVARADIKAFCSLLGKVLPMTLTGAEGGPLVVEIVRLAAVAERPNGPHPTA